MRAGTAASTRQDETVAGNGARNGDDTQRDQAWLGASASSPMPSVWRGSDSDGGGSRQKNTNIC